MNCLAVIQRIVIRPVVRGGGKGGMCVIMCTWSRPFGCSRLFPEIIDWIRSFQPLVFNNLAAYECWRHFLCAKTWKQEGTYYCLIYWNLNVICPLTADWWCLSPKPKSKNNQWTCFFFKSKICDIHYWESLRPPSTSISATLVPKWALFWHSNVVQNRQHNWHSKCANARHLLIKVWIIIVNGYTILCSKINLRLKLKVAVYRLPIWSLTTSRSCSSSRRPWLLEV